MLQKNNNVLMVGGNGFIGSHLADALLSGGFRVRVLDTKRERFRTPLPAVEYFSGLSTDQGLLGAALAGCDTLIHLVHNNIPPSSPQQSEQGVVDSVNAFSNLLCMAGQYQVKRIVFFSSGGAVYGEPTTCPVSETAPCRPISPYGRAKLLMEQMLVRFHAEHGLDYLVVRPSNPFGPRQDFRGQQGVIPIFLHRLMTGQPISIWGDGRAVKDYLYVTDLAAAVLALMRTGFDNTIYNIGSGSGTSLRSIIALLETETGRTANVEYTSARATDVKNNVLAVAKLIARTGWQPRISMGKGIHLTRRWYEENVRTIPGTPGSV